MDEKRLEKRLVIVPVRFSDSEVEMIDVISEIIFNDEGRYLNRSEIIRAATLPFVAERLAFANKCIRQLEDTGMFWIIS